MPLYSHTLSKEKEMQLKIVRLFLCSLALCLLIQQKANGELYQWTDTDGSVHFSDNPSNIPMGKRPIVRQDDQVSPPTSTLQSSSTRGPQTATNLQKKDKTIVNPADELGSLKWFERYFTYQPPSGYVLDESHTPAGYFGAFNSVFYSRSGNAGKDFGHIEFVFMDLKSDRNYRTMEEKKLDFRGKIKWISGGNWRENRGVFSTLAGNQVYILDDMTSYVYDKKRYVYEQKIYTLILKDIWLTISIDAMEKAELAKIIRSIESMNIDI